MKEEPKKIWLDSDGAAWEHYSEEDTLYIRADIVDELVEALEEGIAKSSSTSCPDYLPDYLLELTGALMEKLKADILEGE